MSVKYGDLKLAENVEITHVAGIASDLVIDGERFPYHLSLDDGIQIDEPEFDEDGRLINFGVVHVGILFAPPES